MMWRNKETSTNFDKSPINGLFFLDGDVISRANDTDWMRGMKSSAIVFPSGLLCEIDDYPSPYIYLCVGIGIPFCSTREKAYDTVQTQNVGEDYSLFKVGETRLELWHHETETVWFVTYDNERQQVIDVSVTEPYWL